jgi:MoxR-like ATPase
MRDIGGPEAIQTLLRGQAYLAGGGLATALYLAITLDKPLLLEGEAGVGKTEVARALAAALELRLIRLQCYEGIDAHQALYDWNYPKQLLHIRALSAGEAKGADVDELFGDEYLVERPLLAAIRAGRDALLLIDEIDRADDEFEAFLLEVLSDYQITIPEIGTISAAEPPIVILTSNRTREIHDALKRRCLYHWVDYPNAERELEILRTKVPGCDERLSRQVVGFVQRLRERDLFKLPGIAETLDWAGALTQLDKISLDQEVVDNTLGVLLKYQDDIQKIQGSEAAKILEDVKRGLSAAKP